MNGDFEELKHWRLCPHCHLEKGPQQLDCMECNNLKRQPSDVMIMIRPFGEHVPAYYAVCETCFNEYSGLSGDELQNRKATADTRRAMQAFIDRIKK